VQTLDRDRHHDALTKLREDQVRAARLCLKILDRKTGRLIPLEANEMQLVVERARQRQLEETGRVRMLILKARQHGISTWVGGIVYVGTKLHMGRRGKVLADKLDRSAAIFSIYERFERESPEIIARNKVAAERKKELAWEGDSGLLVGTANDPDVGRSETLRYIHCSEFAFYQYPGEVLLGLLQAVPPNLGEVYLESTANGLGNEFHAMWEVAVAGESGWIAVFIPWFCNEDYRVSLTDSERTEIASSKDPVERALQDVGVFWSAKVAGDDQHHKLSPEQVAFRRAKIADDFQGDERRWRQEYPATPEEAFIASGGAFFDEEGLGSLTEATRDSKPQRRSLVAGKLQHAELGAIRIFEMPSEYGHYVIGADTASGREVKALASDNESGGLTDYSSADILKVAEWTQVEGKWLLVPCRSQVAQYHGYLAPAVFAEGLAHLGVLYCCRVAMGDRDERSPALIVVERNHSSGQSTIRWLQDHSCPRIFRDRPDLALGDKKPTVKYGFLTDEGSRRMVLDHYAALVREGTSGVTSPDTVREMRTFVANKLGRPEGQEGCHDDRVISYALALEAERWHSHGAPSTHYEPKVKPTPTGV